MRLIRTAAGVLNQTPLDWLGNQRRIIASIEQAREQQVSLLCLPELCLTGYGCEDAFHASGVQNTAIESLGQISQHTAEMIVSVGLPLAYAGGLFNTAALLVDTRIVGFVAKQHLAGDGIHYEPRWFKRWPEGVVGQVEIAGVELPIGDLIFDVGGIRIAFEICEDAWVGDRPGASHSSRGADFILNPSASHFAFGKHSVRRRFVIEGSRAFHVSYVYANLVGNEAGRAIYDGDAMIASGGELLAVGPRFSYQPASLTCATVNVEATRMTRSRTGSFEPDLDGDESDVITVPFEYPDCPLQPTSSQLPQWEESPELKFEEFSRSVALGLFDYMRKSHTHGFVVSLSGGVDSTAVVMLAAMMIRLAVAEIGMPEFRRRSGGFLHPSTDSIASASRQMITTAYQSTRHSSETTQHAAARVAQLAGSKHLLLDVEPFVQQYTDLVSAALDRQLDWQTDDLTLQNIQARVRSPSIWMIANVMNALLLSTSNRSESAVGYTTMDGDTSGGLAPIAGIDKAFLRRWLVWMEKHGPDDIGPFPDLRCVNVQQPTAELRPASSSQTDEGDLMPYEVLDVIERLAIRDKLMPLEVFRHLQIKATDYSDEDLATWTIRFFRLWCRNQWKRERFAPSFHLDDENLDPKTWCRFPILSGGYELEIAKLQQYLAEHTGQSS